MADVGSGKACYCMLLRYDIADILTSYLGVDEVTRLLCTSKRAQQEVVQHFSSKSDAARRLVVAAAEDAAAKVAANKACKSRQSVSADQALHRFRMLIDQDLLPKEDSVIGDLLNVAHLPAAVAADVIESGRTFSYQQLLPAVKAMVPGVEVWMRVCRHFKVQAPKGMHAAAEALCCDQELCLQDLECAGITRDILVDLLHFAVAMPRVGTALDSLTTLCRLPAAKKVSADEVFQLVQAAVQVGSSNRVETLMQRLPTAEQLSGEQMHILVQTVAEGSNSRIVIAETLCTCAAASRITAEFAMNMLVSTLKKVADRQANALEQVNALGVLQALCEIPAAQQLAASEVLQLLRLAAETKSDTSHPLLNPITNLGTTLPAAKDLSAAEVAQLLKVAVAAGLGIMEMSALFGMGRAKDIDESTLLELVGAANNTGHDNDGGIRDLWAPPRLRQSSPDSFWDNIDQS